MSLEECDILSDCFSVDVMNFGYHETWNGWKLLPCKILIPDDSTLWIQTISNGIPSRPVFHQWSKEKKRLQDPSLSEAGFQTKLH